MRVPGGVSHSAARTGAPALRPSGRGRRQDRIVGDRDRPSARISAGISKGVELLQVETPQSRHLFEHTSSGVIQRFVGSDRAAGKRPGSGEGLFEPSHKQQLQTVFDQREAGNVYGQDQLTPAGHYSTSPANQNR